MVSAYLSLVVVSVQTEGVRDGTRTGWRVGEWAGVMGAGVGDGKQLVSFLCISKKRNKRKKNKIRKRIKVLSFFIGCCRFVLACSCCFL